MKGYKTMKSTLHRVDYEMLEYTSEILYRNFKSKTHIPDEIKNNYKISIASIIISKQPPGDNFYKLYDYLDAELIYRDKLEDPIVSYGAVKGAIDIYDTIIRLNKSIE